MRRLVPVLLAGLCLCAVQAHKYEPINSEYAPPVEVFILDISPQFFRLAEGRTLYSLPEAGLEMPLTGWSQIEVSVPYLLLDLPGKDSRKGWGDLELGFRALLPRWRGGPIWAANLELSIPTGDRSEGLGGQATEVAAGLFATQEFRRSLLFANFSYAAEFPRENEGHENILKYATAAVFHWTDLLHPTLELFGESNLTEGESEAFLAPEIIFNLGRRAEFKWALPVGLTGSSADWGIQFQLTLFLTGHPDVNLPGGRHK